MPRTIVDKINRETFSTSENLSKLIERFATEGDDRSFHPPRFIPPAESLVTWRTETRSSVPWNKKRENDLTGWRASFVLRLGLKNFISLLFNSLPSFLVTKKLKEKVVVLVKGMIRFRQLSRYLSSFSILISNVLIFSCFRAYFSLLSNHISFSIRATIRKK